jgi:hypothetical protein
MDAATAAAGAGSIVRASALVEFVDIMPTLIEAALGASALPELCPPDSREVELCVEGHSLLVSRARILRMRVEIMESIIIIKNWLRFPYDSTFLRSHYLHPHP